MPRQCIQRMSSEGCIAAKLVDQRGSACLDDDEVDEEIAAGCERGAQDLGDARRERQHQADLGEDAAALHATHRAEVSAR